ncbi:MAG TPA: squalene synthase HpnC [Solirubrobacteraceae bacterium]|jgi:phytoene synthase|nr:squalene synthase HpnC [Solirubrobacteraceae bacterium]
MTATAEAQSASEPLPTPGEVLAQAASENFPVAMGILGHRTARHLMAIYGFARLVDDVGDEVSGDRSALLDELDREIGSIFSDGTPVHPLMRELAQTVRECSLPRGPLDRLVQANRQDQRVSRYDSFEDLLAYCQLSAAPVGELVLNVFGKATAERIALSDLVCAGLQVIEHLQDVVEDRRRGRIYLPQEDLRRFGCDDADLDRAPTPPELRALIAFEADRAGALLQAGPSLTVTLSGRGRLAVAGFVTGGRTALRGLERVGYDISGPRPSAGRLPFALSFAAAVAGR